MEFLVLGIFCLGLIICIFTGLSIIYALLVGLILFLFYGKIRGFSCRELGEMALQGVGKVKNILITFVLIGMMTALWRAAGTIPAVICYTIPFIKPSIFVLMVFILNCFISVLTGTALGTAATVGVVCATMAGVLNISPWLIGGAVLSGVYFGDRCSPVSTSALLVAELTGTDIYQNIKTMIRSAAVPFGITCIIYVLLSISTAHNTQMPDMVHIFSEYFEINFVVLIPAIIILLLSVLRMGVKISMLASILSAIPVCIFVQHMNWNELPALLVTGYHAKNVAMASMLDGGGILSMLKVGIIVCVSSSYSGIFQKTGILKPVQKMVERLSERTVPFLAILLTAVVTSIVACNQTLAIMLTRQLCENTEKEPGRMAGYLEDSAVIVAPLVPWSIASAVPLAAISAPETSVLLACFLYLLPVCTCLEDVWKRKKSTRVI